MDHEYDWFICGHVTKQPAGIQQCVLGIAESLHQESKIQKCKVFLIWHIKWLIIILWALHQWPVNRAWFELFALLGAKILQTPVHDLLVLYALLWQLQDTCLAHGIIFFSDIATTLFSSLGAKAEKVNSDHSDASE